MRKVLFTIALLILATVSNATIVNLSSLPYTVASGDTIRFNGTKLQASVSGITLPNGVDSVLIDGQNDTLEFATAADVDNATALIFGTAIATAPRKVDVRNLTILLDQSAADTAHRSCIGVTGGGHGVRFTNVKFVIGSGAACQSMLLGANVTNWLLTDCQFADSMALNPDRHSVVYAVTSMATQVTAIGSTIGGVPVSWHFRAVNCQIWNAFAKGFVIRGASGLYGCKVYINTYNQYNPASEGNSFAVMLRGILPSSNTTLYPVGMRQCTLLTTANYKGGRGVHITSTNCTIEKPMALDSNYINLSLGPNGESQNCYAVQFEADATTSMNKNIRAKQNLIIVTGDDNPATAYIGNAPAPIRLYPTDVDTNISFDSNTIFAIAYGSMASSAAADISAVTWQFTANTSPAPPVTKFDSTITFRYNTVNSGIPFFMNSRGMVEGNTLRTLSIDSCATNTRFRGTVEYQPGFVSNYAGGTRDTGAWFVDNTYINTTDTAVRHYSATTTAYPPMNAYIARRATITVIDNASAVVPGANVTVKDKNGKTWYTGVTDGLGQVRAIAPYYYNVQTGAGIFDTVFNPYKCYANTGGANDSTSVSWSTTVGSATVQLAGGGGVTPVNLEVRGGVTVRGGVNVRKQ